MASISMDGPLKDSGLRKTFNSIDTDGKGHFTRDDLVAFAQKNGLPGSYASNFISAVLGGSGEGEDAEVTFAMFRRFVRSREDALRRAFNLFDRDKDGHISLEDLDASLAHVSVCCPKTRCIYRCRQRMATELLQKASLDGNVDSGKLGFSQFRDFFLLLPQTDMMVEYWLSAGSVPDMDTRVAIREASAKGSPWGHLMAGAVAGAVSRTATAPLETLRLAAMAGQLQSRNLAQAATDIVVAAGWRGLFRGNLLNVMRSAPQKALDFFAFDAFKKMLGDDTYTKMFMAAGMAGVTSWVALYPIEVVRSRVTVSACLTAAQAAAAPAGGLGLVATLRTIINCEGAGALYRGLGPSVAAIFPEAAITYGLHDALKRIYTKLRHEEPGVGPSLAFGVLSAFMGQLVSFPLETVSRRLQLAQGPGAGGPGAIGDMVKALLRDGGPAALYRGIGAATLRLIPMACVSFGTYELVRSLIVSWEQQQDEARARKELLATRCVPLVLQGPNGDAQLLGRLCTNADGNAVPCNSGVAACGPCAAGTAAAAAVLATEAGAGECISCGPGCVVSAAPAAVAPASGHAALQPCMACASTGAACPAVEAAAMSATMSAVSGASSVSGTGASGCSSSGGTGCSGSGGGCSGCQAGGGCNAGSSCNGGGGGVVGACRVAEGP